MTPGGSRFVSTLVHSGVELVTAVPDSLTASALHDVGSCEALTYIQAADESSAVCLAAGFALAGRRSIVIMENSGLRRGCEALARLGLTHGIHVVALISYRGAFGEANWWGIGHHATMAPLLDALGLRSAEVRTADELARRLPEAYSMFQTRETSVALVVHREALDG